MLLNCRIFREIARDTSQMMAPLAPQVRRSDVRCVGATDAAPRPAVVDAAQLGEMAKTRQK